MAIAVGTSFVLQVINAAVAVYDKNGTLQMGFPKAATDFFGLAAGTFISDPRTFYDRVFDRFVVIMVEETNRFSSSNQGLLLMAVSQTADPRGTWFVWGPAFQVGNTGECADYPTLGQDYASWVGSSKGGIYIGFNQFGNSASGPPCANIKNTFFLENYVFFIPKDQVYEGNLFNFWEAFGFSLNGKLVDSLQPSNPTQQTDKPRAEFLVNTKNFSFGHCSQGCNGLVVWAISNPFGFISGGPAPEVTGVVIPTAHNYTFPSNADEPECPGCVDTGDNRISGSVKLADGELFGAFETSSGKENSPIWFELHPLLNDGNNARCTGSFTNWCADLVAVDKRQEDCFVCNQWAGNGSAYYGTIQPDAEDNLTMVYNFSNSSFFPGTAVTSRRVTQADSQMHDPGFFIQIGLSKLVPFGDYTATAPDLTIPSTDFPTLSFQSMWVAGMFGRSDGFWATQIARTSYKSVNQL